ncbi:MAG TPA: arsinothricin resistance N-acetyltransferase ArsN1 family A [Longimicrobiales bacterium]|nr:arsinothricin resistance N-acetyltransferase ArsN1 family A [Longimicrobiales bacterium]
MGEPVQVRVAEPRDAAAIARIYNEGIQDRVATFETRERVPAEVLGWLGDPRHPVLVAERASEVVGWASASRYRDRECYAGIAEFSVYVGRSARGAGVGDALMAAFIAACEAAGVWKLVSRVFPENAASRGLCRRHGFREVGTYRKHARLDGVWRDVVIVERLLEANLTPRPALAGSADENARIR